MKQTYKIVIVLLVTIISITACRKKIEAGKNINVSGIVFDPVKNKPLPNAKLYLYGSKQTFYGTYYTNGPLDSTISDNLGKFTIHFTAKGNSVDYGLTIGDFGYYSPKNYVVDNLEPMFKFNHSTSISNAVVRARELNYTKVHLKVIVNPYDSFYLRTSASGVESLAIGQSIDTTIVVRHLPNEKNYYDYYTKSLRDTIGLAALNSNPNTHHFGVLRLITDTIMTNMSDTISINKTFPNSLLIPRY
jgi:hypothetical protein